MSFALHTRAFDAPLFGSSTSTTLYLHAGQRFRDGSYWTTSFYRGFPLVQSLFTVEGDHVPWRGGLAAIRAGEVTLQPIGDPGAVDAYTIEGVAARWQRRNEEWMVYAGDGRYPTLLPGLRESAPRLGGVEYRRRFGNASAGGAVIALGDATTPDDDPVHTVLRGDYDYALSPATQLFSRAYVAGNGSTAFRIGSRFASLRRELTASIFSFDEDFPLVYPLFRPGERGGELYGSYRVTELSRAYGAVTYLSSDRLLGRSNLRGHLGYAFAAGSDGPHFDVSYHRDELTHDVLSATRQDIIADRFSFGITRSSLAESLAVRLDHVLRNEHPQRTQLLASYARLVGLESTVDSSLVVQREDSTIGVTAEGIYERPVRWPYSVRIGAGAALIHQEVEDRGEGVARLGISRRFVGQLSGWYAQVEARASFPIGLTRSNLSSNTITIGFGNRLGWNDLRHARSVFTALVSPSDFGAVEGHVQFDGKGLANVPILIEGQRLAVTGADGRYRISRLRTGIVSVTIDTSVLEQGFVVSGPASRSVLVAPRGVARADFAITRRVALAGSLARCKDGEVLPLRGARIAMLGDQFVQTATTSSSGGFEFDAIPPGTYDLVIDPASVPEVSPGNIARRQIELTADMLGYVILLECGSVETTGPPSTDRPPTEHGVISGVVLVNGIAIHGAALLVDGQPRGRTGSDGSWSVTVAPGTYMISIALPERDVTGPIEADANRRVTIGQGERLEARFDLQRRSRLTGRVIRCDAKEERPILGATVSLLGPRHAETVTGANGLFVMENVPAGSYVVVVDASGLEGVLSDGVLRLAVDLTSDRIVEIRVGCGR